MATERDLLSTEIVKRGVERDGPNAGSQTFSVRVRRRLPDFLQSVNLKYVKLGYHYLITHGIYLATVPVVVLVTGAEIGSLSRDELWRALWVDARYDLPTLLAFFALFLFTLAVYLISRPRSIYLLDFACYKPSDDLKVYLTLAFVLYIGQQWFTRFQVFYFVYYVISRIIGQTEIIVIYRGSNRRIFASRIPL